MILNKQNWQNNFWFGENDRAQNLRLVRMAQPKTADMRLATITWAEPDPLRVWGVDVSGRWDGNVNFSPTKAAGASFAIIKCMDGTVPTRLWLENRRRAIAAGLVTGEYCWLYPNKHVSAKAQAQAVWNLIKGQPRQLPLTVDFEWTRWQGAWSNPTYADLEIFLAEFVRLAGYRPIVYTAAGFTNPMGRVPETILSLCAGIWVANYNVPKPTMPMGVSKWLFWQFAATGEASRLAPNDTGKLELDLNYYGGTEKELYKLGGLLVGEPPSNDGENPMPEYRFEATSNYRMSLRPQPTTSNQPQETIPVGVVMRGDFVSTGADRWLHVLEAGGAAKDGWVAIVYQGVTYCTLTDHGDPAPTPAPQPAVYPVRLDGTVTLSDGSTHAFTVTEFTKDS